ncbi:hypothetical protein [Enterococcus mundtii]|nr:hypothetical protein [Enterococcus mundtii]
MDDTEVGLTDVYCDECNTYSAVREVDEFGEYKICKKCGAEWGGLQKEW